MAVCNIAPEQAIDIHMHVCSELDANCLFLCCVAYGFSPISAPVIYYSLLCRLCVQECDDETVSALRLGSKPPA